MECLCDNNVPEEEIDTFIEVLGTIIQGVNDGTLTAEQAATFFDDLSAVTTAPLDDIQELLDTIEEEITTAIAGAPTGPVARAEAEGIPETVFLTMT